MRKQLRGKCLLCGNFFVKNVHNKLYCSVIRRCGKKVISLRSVRWNKSNPMRRGVTKRKYYEKTTFKNNTRDNG